MSKTDSHLILKIADLLQMFPDNYEISEILSNYRKTGDPDAIYHKLCTYEEKTLLSQIELKEVEEGVDLEGEVKEDRDNYFYWIGVGDNFTCHVRSLKSMKKMDMWEDNRPVFAIRINEVNANFTSTSFPHPNTDIKFFSEHLRDREWDRVRKRLSSFTFVRFL